MVIADLLLAQLTPLAIETSLQIHEELHAQVQEASRLRAQQVERARYAAELAQRRFLRVDPENRLVADVLEADWNARLRELAEVTEQAVHLNEQGWRTYEGKPFTAARVLSLRRYRRLKDHATRLAERGWLNTSDAASAYGVCRETLMLWGRAGLLPMSRINEQGTAMFPPPDQDAPRKNAHKFAKTKTRSSCGRSAVCN